MTPETVIRQAAADGVSLALSPPDNVKVVGDERAVDRWLPVIRQHKRGIVAALQEAANDDTRSDPGAEACQQRVLAIPTANAHEVFEFAPPGDPANDDEALRERVALMMEGNGWDEPTALREARWAADRERCWRVFLRNAQRVLAAHEAHREELLAQYQTEATGRYGEATARDMAGSLRNWIAVRGLH